MESEADNGPVFVSHIMFLFVGPLCRRSLQHWHQLTLRSSLWEEVWFLPVSLLCFKARNGRDESMHRAEHPLLEANVQGCCAQFLQFGHARSASSGGFQKLSYLVILKSLWVGLSKSASKPKLRAQQQINPLCRFARCNAGLSPKIQSS